MKLEILVAVAVLHNGMVIQQAIHTPDRKECEITRPLIEQQIREGQPDLAHVKSICLEFNL